MRRLSQVRPSPHRKRITRYLHTYSSQKQIPPPHLPAPLFKAKRVTLSLNAIQGIRQWVARHYPS